MCLKHQEKVHMFSGVGELVFYFSPKDYMPDERHVISVGYGLIYNGDCTGVEFSRLMNGEVRVYYNPMVQNKANLDRVINKMKEAIKAPNNNGSMTIEL